MHNELYRLIQAVEKGNAFAYPGDVGAAIVSALNELAEVHGELERSDCESVSEMASALNGATEDSDRFSEIIAAISASGADDLDELTDTFKKYRALESVFNS